MWSMGLAPFPHSTLEAVAAILGETDAGLSNKEIADLLRSANIADPKAVAEAEDPRVAAGLAYVRMSKSDRIRSALANHQGRRHTGDALVALIHAAMKPQRYVNDHATFTRRRAQLNEVLVFQALEVNEAGRVCKRSQAARTLADASEMAGTMSAQLRQLGTHPNVLSYCTAEVLTKNNFHASLEATKGIFDRLRLDLGLTTDGGALVDEVFAFRGQIPLLALSELRTESQQSEQSGFMNVLKGLYSMYRNPTAHEAKVTREASRPVSDVELLELFTMISMIHRRLDSAIRPSSV
jgi:uncharacterized protein (TIGR02391 family)